MRFKLRLNENEEWFCKKKKIKIKTQTHQPVDRITNSSKGFFILFAKNQWDEYDRISR